MNRLSAMLSFLAAAPGQQQDALPSLPLDPGDRDFHAHFARNPLLLLTQAYLRFFFHRDDESWETFLERLGAPDDTPWPESAAELSYVLDTVRTDDRSLWTKKALSRKVEWRVVRRLARVMLGDLGWTARVDAGELTELLRRYTPVLEEEWREEGRTWG